MSINPLVSVIIIFFNSEEFLEEAIKSVISQSYNNWEILLVDDGSTDKSTEIAKIFSADFPEKIHYLEHPNHENKGMSASRNLGIKYSKGEFITFLDSDDIFLKQKLEEQLKIFYENPEVSVVIGGVKLWFSWYDQNKKDKIHSLQIPRGKYLQGEYFKLFITQKAAVPGICSVMVRKSLIDITGGFENDFTGMYEDQVFLSKITIDGVVYVDSNYYELYRKHPNSNYQKSIAMGTVLQFKKKFFTWLKEYVVIKEIKDNEIFYSIKKELWLCDHPFLDYLHRRILKQKRKYFSLKSL